MIMNIIGRSSRQPLAQEELQLNLSIPLCTIYLFRKNRKCKHCKKRGKNCHNICFGPYLAAILARFHRKHHKYCNKFDAVCLFVENYGVLAEFEDDHIKRNNIQTTSYSNRLPECIEFDSLVFALNAVEQTIIWNVSLNIDMMVEDNNDEKSSEDKDKNSNHSGSKQGKIQINIEREHK